MRTYHVGLIERGRTAVFLEWFKDDPNCREKAMELRHAFGAVQELTEAYRLRCSAETHLSNIRRRIEASKTTEVA